MLAFTADIRRCWKIKMKSLDHRGRAKKTWSFPGDVKPAFVRLHKSGTETRCSVLQQARLRWTLPQREGSFWQRGGGRAGEEITTPPPGKPEHLLAKNKKHQDWRVMDDWSPSAFFYNFTGLSSVGSCWELIKWVHSFWQQITYALILGWREILQRQQLMLHTLPGAMGTPSIWKRLCLPLNELNKVAHLSAAKAPESFTVSDERPGCSGSSAAHVAT